MAHDYYELEKEKVDGLREILGAMAGGDEMEALVQEIRASGGIPETRDGHDPVVDHPSHYNTGKIEVIDFIEDKGLGFHLGNVVKYVVRAPYKNGLEDLKKARWYLDREILRLSKEGTR